MQKPRTTLTQVELALIHLALASGPTSKRMGLMEENPNVFLAFGFTCLILPSDFHFGRGVAVGAHPCLAAAGCPEVVDEPLGEISGIVAAVSDVRSKSCPLPILRREKRDQDSF